MKQFSDAVMKFGNAVIGFFVNFANFKGRTNRRDYWLAILFVVLVDQALSIIFADQAISETSPLATMFNLGQMAWNLLVLIPCLAVGARRLQDSGRSAMNLFWLALWVIGWVYLLYLLVQPSSPEENQYGKPVN